MRVAIFGASGFLGGNLGRYLLENTDWQVRAVSRDPSKVSQAGQPVGRFEIIAADVTDYDSVVAALKDVDVAYYFVHMMGHKVTDFYDRETKAARQFVKAADAAGLGRLIYMGGLGTDGPGVSQHLASRHETGKILRGAKAQVIEFRASMIVAPGSVAYDIISSAADKLPILPLPKIADTLTQPIALRDALKYLAAAATVKLTRDEIVDIGGPTAVSYKDVYRLYAKQNGLHRLVFPVPFIPSYFSSLFLDLITPKIHARIGRAMIDSMTTAMVVQNQRAAELFPAIRPVSLEAAFQKVA